MATRTHLSPSQRRALAELSELPLSRGLYLAGGVAVALHLGHRSSRDLDLFAISAELDLDVVRRMLVETEARVEVVGQSDATLHVRFNGADLDVVRYPYPLLSRPLRHETGIRVASLRDLAAMKLAAIAKRGLRRDFWDLHEILSSGKSSLARVLDDYRKKFAVSEADVYHVLRALSWFEDAEADRLLPKGLTVRHWRAVRAYFEEAAPAAMRRRERELRRS